MMISPETYRRGFEKCSYEDCLKERDRLIRSIRHFEKGKTEEFRYHISPSPDCIYSCELKYLSEICDLMSYKFLVEKNEKKCQLHDK